MSVEEKKKDERMSISTQLYLQKKISMYEQEHSQELFNILKKNTDKYTVNSNGVFVNMKDLDNETLLKIKKHVDFIDAIQEKLEQKRI